MPRPKLCRNIFGSPTALFFSPSTDTDQIVNVATISLEEFESIRLGDWLGLYHDECARQMGVSRQTFGNVITVARQKIAGAIVNGQAIRIAGSKGCCHNQSSVCDKCSSLESCSCKKIPNETACCGKKQKRCCKGIFLEPKKEKNNEDMPAR